MKLPAETSPKILWVASWPSEKKHQHATNDKTHTKENVRWIPSSKST